jgi:hypothetical protein
MTTKPMTTDSPENSAEVGIDVQRLVRLWRVSVYDCAADIGKLWSQKFFLSERQAKEELLAMVHESNGKHDEHRQFTPREIKGFQAGFYCACFNEFMGLDTVNIEVNDTAESTMSADVKSQQQPTK